MASYRFKTAEIEAMKQNILTHIEHETETKTAWRLRCAIEGQLMCCRPSKRETARLERELALYEQLTTNDLPNWQSKPTQPATPTETPRIVRVEIVRDFDNTYYANLFDENGCSHNLSKEYTAYRTMKSLCKREYGAMLPNLADVEFEKYGRKSYAYISTETPQIPTQAAEAGKAVKKPRIRTECEHKNLTFYHEGSRVVEQKELIRTYIGDAMVCECVITVECYKGVRREFYRLNYKKYSPSCGCNLSYFSRHSSRSELEAAANAIRAEYLGTPS